MLISHNDISNCWTFYDKLKSPLDISSANWDTKFVIEKAQITIFIKNVMQTSLPKI